MDMKKLTLILSIIFAILSFCGCGYIFYTDGNASPAYACLPMIFELICVSMYRKINKSDDKDDKQ